MDATLYDYNGVVQGVVATGINPVNFPLRVQIRFGVFVDTFQIGSSTRYTTVSDVVGTHESTTLFTDLFSSDGGTLGSSAPTPWNYADTYTSDPVNASCVGVFSGGQLQLTGTTNNTVSSDYQAAWAWISKEDILIPMPATPTTYTFTWNIDTDLATSVVTGLRGTGFASDGSPYPDDPFEMLISGFNVFSATGSNAPFSPYGDPFFGPDLSMINAPATSPFTGPWGYSIVFTDVTTGLHVWQRA